MGQGFTKDKAKKLADGKFKDGDYEGAVLYYSKILQHDKVTISLYFTRILRKLIY